MSDYNWRDSFDSIEDFCLILDKPSTASGALGRVASFTIRELLSDAGCSLDMAIFSRQKDQIMDLNARNTELEGQIQHRNGNLAFATAAIDEKNDRITELETELKKAKAEGVIEAVAATEGCGAYCYVPDLLKFADQLEGKPS